MPAHNNNAMPVSRGRVMPDQHRPSLARTNRRVR